MDFYRSYSKVTINYNNFDRCESYVKSQGSESFSGRFILLFLVVRTKTNFNSKCSRKGLDPMAFRLNISILLESGRCLIELRCCNLFSQSCPESFVFHDTVLYIVEWITCIYFFFEPLGDNCNDCYRASLRILSRIKKLFTVL